MLTNRTILALAATAFAALAIAQTTPDTQTKPFSPETKQAVLASIEKVLTTTAFVPGVDFTKWPGMIEKKKGEIEASDSANQFTNVVNGALHEFGFSHCVLYSPTVAQARTNRKMVGLGVRIQPEEKGIRIVWVFPESPAMESGIEPGDLIFEADGKAVRQAGDLGGEEGSTVKLKLTRDGKELTKTITRRAFSTDIPESVTWVDKETAVLTVPTFDLGYNKNKALDKAMKEAMTAKRLILDLRGNGGGSVVNLLHLAGYFLKRDEPLGTFIGKSLVKRYQEDTGDKSTDVLKIAAWPEASRLKPATRVERYTGQVAVLVNGGTGSASEMMASAMREYRGAKVIGTKSAGAVLASYMWPVAEGFTLQFPVTDYVTIKGYRIEGNGVKPDVEVDAPVRFGEPDKVVLAAVKALSG